jgi:hypothetical protein
MEETSDEAEYVENHSFGIPGRAVKPRGARKRRRLNEADLKKFERRFFDVKSPTALILLGLLEGELRILERESARRPRKPKS